MQYNISSGYMELLVFLVLIILIMTVLLVLFHTRSKIERLLNNELLECLDCKDTVLDEFREIRHEYNNMLHTMNCLIEEEAWGELEEYQDRLMERAHLLNNNSLSQLARIKDRNILVTLHKFLVTAEKDGKTLNLYICNDIADTGFFKAELCIGLQESMKHAYASAAKGAGEIDLRISSNDDGLQFCFESSNDTELGARSKHFKNIFYNTLQRNGRFIQEILVSYR